MNKNMTSLSESFNSQIDYSKSRVLANGPSYRFSKITQQAGGETVAISATSNVEVVFDLPAGSVFNLSKSMLRYDTTIPAGSTGYTAALVNTPPIQSVALRTRGGKYLCNIENLQHYWKMVRYFSEPADAFQNRPQVGTAATIANAKLKGVNHYWNPSNALSSTAPAAVTVHSNKIGDDGLLVIPAGLKHYSSAVEWITSGSLAANAMYNELKLGDLCFSFFGVDRDFFSAEALQLVVSVSAWDNWVFGHSAEATLADPLTVPCTPTITNLGLYLALEANPLVKQSIIDKVMSSSLNMLIPYPYLYRTNIGTATSGVITQRLNPGHGRSLLRIMSAESLTTDSLNKRANFYNVDGAKTEVFHTELDSIRLQQENMECKKNGDLIHIKHLLGSSALSQSPAEYYTNYVFVDDWSACKDLVSARESDLQPQGMALDREYLYSKSYDTKSGTNTTCNMIVVCQKEVVSSANGVDVVG